MTPTSGASADDDTATYELVVDITWSAATAPFEFPESAHLSRLIGATHSGRYVLFRDGQTASSGLELLAENGRTTILEAEFAEATRRGRLGSAIAGPGLNSPPGSVRTEFTAKTDHPLLSFATMIAPSPDWFTGAADIELLTNDGWIDGAEVVLWAWDAGTDGGQTYSAPNDDSQPRESVRLLASRHFLNNSGLLPVGTAKLRRVQP